MSALGDEDERFVEDITNLANRIDAKLLSLTVLEGDAIGNIAHHLAEVCVQTRRLDREIVPRFLSTPVSDQETLGDLSHELMSELEEVRDSIDSMLSDLTALMNSLNK